MRDFTQYRDYIPFPSPIPFDGFEAIGMFPYEKAQLLNGLVRVHANIFDHLYEALREHMDNKVVVIFKDTRRFNTENFAIQWKDGMCKMGDWRDVIGYANQELYIKK